MPLRPHTVTVTRIDTTGNVIGSDGTITQGTPSTFTIQCNAQPDSKVQMDDLPELRGFKEVYRVYSDVELFTADEQLKREADKVLLKGKQYEIRTCQHWNESLIPHYQSYAAR